MKTIITMLILMLSLTLATGAYAGMDSQLRSIASKIHNVQASVASLNGTLKETNKLLAQMVKLMAERGNNGNHNGQEKE